MAPEVAHDVAREAHGAKLLVVAKFGFQQGIAEHRIVDPRADSRDLARRIDLTFKAVFAAGGELHAAHAGLALDPRVVGQRGFHESLRRRPDLRATFLDGGRLSGGRCSRGYVRGHVPGTGAGDKLVDLLLHRCGTHAARLNDLRPCDLHARSRRAVVDARAVVGDGKLRPSASPAPGAWPNWYQLPVAANSSARDFRRAQRLGSARDRPVWLASSFRRNRDSIQRECCEGCIYKSARHVVLPGKNRFTEVCS